MRNSEYNPQPDPISRPPERFVPPPEVAQPGPEFHIAPERQVYQELADERPTAAAATNSPAAEDRRRQQEEKKRRAQQQSRRSASVGQSALRFAAMGLSAVTVTASVSATSNGEFYQWLSEKAEVVYEVLSQPVATPREGIQLETALAYWGADSLAELENSAQVDDLVASDNGDGAGDSGGASLDGNSTTLNAEIAAPDAEGLQAEAGTLAEAAIAAEAMAAPETPVQTPAAPAAEPVAAVVPPPAPVEEVIPPVEEVIPPVEEVTPAPEQAPEEIPTETPAPGETGTDGEGGTDEGNSSGSSGGGSSHRHSYTSAVTLEATCTEAGVTTYTCTCGSSYTEPIAATGHAEEDIAAVAATCTATGLTAGSRCSVCGETVKAQTPVAMINHTEVDIDPVAATCTAAGSTGGKKCSVCDTVLTAPTEVDPLAHTYGTTYDGDGTDHWLVCDVCGAADPTKSAHQVTDWTEGTDNHTGSCSVCGNEATQDHSWTNSVCTVCNAVRTTPSNEPEVTSLPTTASVILNTNQTQNYLQVEVPFTWKTTDDDTGTLIIQLYYQYETFPDTPQTVDTYRGGTSPATFSIPKESLADALNGVFYLKFSYIVNGTTTALPTEKSFTVSKSLEDTTWTVGEVYSLADGSLVTDTPAVTAVSLAEVNANAATAGFTLTTTWDQAPVGTVQAEVEIIGVDNATQTKTLTLSGSGTTYSYTTTMRDLLGADIPAEIFTVTLTSLSDDNGPQSLSDTYTCDVFLADATDTA